MSVLEKFSIKIPDIETAYSPEQEQTKDTFGYKWAKRDTYESEPVRRATRNWLMEKYCAGDPNQLSSWLSGGQKIILDAGCGPGITAVLFFGDHLKRHDYLGVDISDAVAVARTRFKEEQYQGDFLKMDLLEIPIPDESVDMIFSEGVLHHTDSTERSLKFLAKKLKAGGRFLFYVYAKKAVIREFTDDHIRAAISPLGNEEAWKALEPLTKLGKALGDLQIELDVPEEIPYLGIPKGKVDLQRFFYWNICKAFYRPEYTLDEMNLINFDWFRPLNCHRHSPEEIKTWCQEAGLEIERLYKEEAGISVVARKKS